MNFYMHSTVLLPMIVQQISRNFSSCVIESLYSLHSNSPLSALPLAPDNHHSALRLCEFDYFRNFM